MPRFVVRAAENVARGESRSTINFDDGGHKSASYVQAPAITPPVVFNPFPSLFFPFCLHIRWAGLRLDLLAASIATAAALFIILVPLSSPSVSGLALLYALQLTGHFQYVARMMGEAGACQGVSWVSRVRGRRGWQV